MFTGIVEKMGVVKGISPHGDRISLTIEAPQILDDVRTGDSIAVNGCCLTVVTHDGVCWTTDVVQESLDRTTLGTLTVGDRVNLEKALRLADRLGGHMVQGHIDGVGTISEKNGLEVTLFAPSDLLHYVVEKGSIAVDGVSLTVTAVTDHTLSFAMIPHTAAETTLGNKSPGMKVNLEVDLIAKHIEKLVRVHV